MHHFKGTKSWNKLTDENKCNELISMLGMLNIFPEDRETYIHRKTRKQ
jgi:hypothetical protein